MELRRVVIALAIAAIKLANLAIDLFDLINPWPIKVKALNYFIIN